MSNISNDNFGPLIAYLVPGATVLLGVSQFSPTLQSWFAASSTEAPSIGGFLYLTVAALAAGMTVSAVRWALVDMIHGFTGLRLPRLDFSKLGENVAAFNLLIDIHYRHYQFYANEFVAVFIAYVCYRVKLGNVWPLGLPDLAVLILEIVFFVASRDTLHKYYARSAQLLRSETSTPSKRSG